MEICQIDSTQDALEIMKDIGVTGRGMQIMAEKAVFLPIRLEHVDTRAANILKQTLLSQGAEAAVSRGTVDLSEVYTDVLVLATMSQLRKSLPRLKEQPWGLKAIAEELQGLLDNGISPGSVPTSTRSRS